MLCELQAHLREPWRAEEKHELARASSLALCFPRPPSFLPSFLPTFCPCWAQGSTGRWNAGQDGTADHLPEQEDLNPGRSPGGLRVTWENQLETGAGMETDYSNHAIALEGESEGGVAEMADHICAPKTC